MVDRDTAIKAGVQGGVSAVLPYAAIGILGFLGLRELKKLNIDVGGAAGQIIDSVSDTVTNITETVTNTIETTKTVIVDNTEGITEDKTFSTDGVPDKHKGKTYTEFMGEQSPLIRLPASVGNIITGDLASSYGKHLSEELTTGVSEIGGKESVFDVQQRFDALTTLDQILIGIGQMVTGGYAAKAGAIVDKYDMGVLDSWKPKYTKTPTSTPNNTIDSPKAENVKSDTSIKSSTSKRYTDSYGQPVDRASGNILSSGALKHPSQYQKDKYGIR